jgi:ATP-dependent helicase HrpA
MMRRDVGSPAREEDLPDGFRRRLEIAEHRVTARREAVPALTYPPRLPITTAREHLLRTIGDHQVVVVAGETGSGKTTQLPKLCLELGRGVRGMIGHTQPRRLAARTLAERIATELAVPVPGPVGYAVRFTDTVTDDTLVKVMTDGLLLAEIPKDRQLLAYDTIILDEAHERSLNIDFLLGYLHRLLPRRPDLKLVITSATIEVDRFARHFHAPVVEVSGRTFPVEIRYRPLIPEPAEPATGTGPPEGTGHGSGKEPRGPSPRRIPREPIDAISDAVTELTGQGPGDILVFLSGEREIRDTAQALVRSQPPGTEILPLYARLSVSEQHRVFAPHPGRRIVLATNIAETSLTVPGIRYVIDAGNARISRYSRRLKVQRLPIEPVSQASARQRAGRCGRLEAGICIRLYSESDFDSRPAFTEPEILRTNLASVLLTMISLDLGQIADFAFLDPPDTHQIHDGLALLTELGAIRPGRDRTRPRLTRAGSMMARLPLDPRLARMVIEGDRRGVLADVLVVVAALSIQDPRERPAEHRAGADAAHARFVDAESDFVGYLNLWNHLRRRQHALSSSKFRRLCSAEYLHYLRIREWQDLHSQLRRVVRDLGMTPGPVCASTGEDPPDGTAGSGPRLDRSGFHQALLSGLLTQVGLRDPRRTDKRQPEYLGTRGARFDISAGSALHRRSPRWVMAAELVETNRLRAVVVARIDPTWIEKLAGDLVTRSYSEPRWDASRGQVMATERVQLYGLALVAGRTIGYGRIDPRLARELFIRHALVEGDWQAPHEFLGRNRDLIAEVQELEHRTRRRDLFVDDEQIMDFYDARIPTDVISGRHFDSWWARARRDRPDLLDLSRSLLLAPDAQDVTETDYPTEWNQGDLVLRLDYRFAPGTDEDGVRVRVPLTALNRIQPEDFDWMVPGHRRELVTALLRGLPKTVRKRFIPISGTVDRVVERLDDHAPTSGGRSHDGDPGRAGAGEPPRPGLLTALSRTLAEVTGVTVSPETWRPERLPDHLRMTFVVVDDSDRERAVGPDLDDLRRQFSGEVAEVLSRAGDHLERDRLDSWTIGVLPRTVTSRIGQRPVQGFPSLVAREDTVAVRILASAREQERAMGPGTRRLLLAQLPSPIRSTVRTLDGRDKLLLADNPHGSVPALLQDVLDCAMDHLVSQAGGPAWDGDRFADLLRTVGPELPGTFSATLERTLRILAAAQQARQLLDQLRSPVLTRSVRDAREQLSALIGPGFVTDSGWQRLVDLHRYLTALRYRLERLPERPQADLQALDQVERARADLQDVVAVLGPSRQDSPEVLAVGWMIQELRVSLFAPRVRTAHPVSVKRIGRAIDALYDRE